MLFADQQPGECKPGFTGGRVALDEVTQAVDGSQVGLLGLQLGAGQRGSLPVRAQKQRFFGFGKGAQNVAGVGRSLCHGEVRFRQGVIGGSDAVNQVLYGFFVTMAGQQAVELQQVAADVGLVLLKHCSQLRRQIINAVCHDQH